MAGLRCRAAQKRNASWETAGRFHVCHQFPGGSPSMQAGTIGMAWLCDFWSHWRYGKSNHIGAWAWKGGAATPSFGGPAAQPFQLAFVPTLVETAILSPSQRF